MSNQKWEVGPAKLVNGRDATIYHYCKTRLRYIGWWIAASGATYAAEWTASGSQSIGGIGDPMLDLAPPPKKTMRFRRFICLYPDGSWSSHLTELESAKERSKSPFAIFEIDREVTDGEGLSETTN